MGIGSENYSHKDRGSISLQFNWLFDYAAEIAHQSRFYRVCIDRRLAKELIDFEVKTVPQMGWAGV